MNTIFFDNLSTPFKDANQYDDDHPWIQDHSNSTADECVDSYNSNESMVDETDTDMKLVCPELHDFSNKLIDTSSNRDMSDNTSAHESSLNTGDEYQHSLFDLSSMENLSKQRVLDMFGDVSDNTVTTQEQVPTQNPVVKPKVVKTAKSERSVAPSKKVTKQLKVNIKSSRPGRRPKADSEKACAKVDKVSAQVQE